jgi:hypothetical protein
MSRRMPNDVGSGFGDAVVGIFEGIIVSALLGIIPLIPNVPSYYVGMIQLFQAVYLIGSILVILAMKSWGFWYLLGWLFGMWIMSVGGLVESWLFTLYVIVGILTMVMKVLQKTGIELKLPIDY